MTEEIKELMLYVFRNYLSDLKKQEPPEEALQTAWRSIKDDDALGEAFVRTAFGAIAAEMDQKDV